MEITLLHNHYNEMHLEKVMEEMQTLGAPEIRCIWAEQYGMWMAIEGCHRLLAAEALGIRPIVIDVSVEDTLVIQSDGEDVEVSRVDLEEELADQAWQAVTVRFEE